MPFVWLFLVRQQIILFAQDLWRRREVSEAKCIVQSVWGEMIPKRGEVRTLRDRSSQSSIRTNLCLTLVVCHFVIFPCSRFHALKSREGGEREWRISYRRRARFWAERRLEPRWAFELCSSGFHPQVYGDEVSAIINGCR